MNKIIIISILLFIQFWGLCQDKLQDSTNVLFLDSLKKIKLKTIFLKSGKIKERKLYYQNVEIEVMYFFKNDTLAVESTYNLKGNEFGWDKEYYENGIIKKERFIINYTELKVKDDKDFFIMKVFNGPFKEYYENAKLKKEGCYINGKLKGLYKEYNIDGTLKKIEYLN